MRTKAEIIKDGKKRQTDSYYIGISGVPADLRRTLIETADRNGRTVSNQIVQILKQWAIQQLI